MAAGPPTYPQDLSWESLKEEEMGAGEYSAPPMGRAMPHLILVTTLRWRESSPLFPEQETEAEFLPCLT